MPNLFNLLTNIFTSVFYILTPNIFKLFPKASLGTRQAIFLQGFLWLAATVIVNSLTDNNYSPLEYLKLNWRFTLLVGFFVFFWSTFFLPPSLFRIANLEAYWIAYFLTKISNFAYFIKNNKTISNEKMIIYLLWMLFLCFFIAIPTFFLGRLGLFLGPILIALLILITNLK